MSVSPRPMLGSVIWAELEDANGIRKLRPAVIVSSTAEIAEGKPLHVLAVTTRLPSPLPDVVGLLPPATIDELLGKIAAKLEPPTGDPSKEPPPAS